MVFKMRDMGIEMISTGGTAKYLREAGVSVREVSDYTGFPEMMGGRVKTLHPKIHGGILALRENKGHLEDLSANAIELIDYVIVNLYPFVETISEEGVSLEKAIENIDIGGPAMIRSAAKNHESVTVVTNPNDYADLLLELEAKGETSLAFRRKMAVKAFEHTFTYDYHVRQYFSEKYIKDEADFISVVYKKDASLRYGENPRQKASAFSMLGSFSLARDAKILSGKEMSYNNYVDAFFARECVADFNAHPAASVVKHGAPCGIATGADIFEAIKYAWEGDVVSAFGSIIAVTREIDLQSAEFFSDKFIEVLVAPSFSEDALNLLSKKKNLRLMATSMENRGEALSYRQLGGMLLLQDKDDVVYDEIKLVSGIHHPEKEGLYYFTYAAVKHIKSNAIAIGFEYKKGRYMLLGMGSGQPNRIDALKKLAIPKAKENINRIYSQSTVKDIFKETVMASDAFFPFTDAVETAFEEGIFRVIQPGGSKNDNEVIKYCQEHDMTMYFTGARHFLH